MKLFPSLVGQAWQQALMLSLLLASPLTSQPAHADDYMYEDEIEYALAERSKKERLDLESTHLSANSGSDDPTPSGRKTTFADPRFSGVFKLDFKSQYISFGIVLQDEGVTIQPMLALRYTFFDKALDNSEDSFVNNVTGFISSWNDISTNKDLSSPTSPYRYYTEADLVTGVSVTFKDRFNLTTSLTELHSPAGAFGPGAFLKAVLSMDDTGILAKDFALKPQFLLIYEIPWESQIGLQPDAFLFEPGITPTYTFGSDTNFPVTLAVPMRVGLGNKFYDGNDYGFFSVGPEFTVPISGLSSQTIKTYASIGYTYINLGPTTTDFILNGDGSSNKHVYNFGLTTTF
jgi:hypothetical protein